LFPAVKDPESIIGLGYATPEGDPTATGRILLAGKKHGLFNEDNSISNSGLALLMSKDDVLKPENLEVYKAREKMNLDDLDQDETGWLQPILDLVKGVPSFIGSAARLAVAPSPMTPSMRAFPGDMGMGAQFGVALAPEAEGTKPEKRPEDIVAVVEAAGQAVKDSATLFVGAESLVGQAYVKMTQEGEIEQNALAALRQGFDRKTNDFSKIDNAVTLGIVLDSPKIVDEYISAKSQLTPTQQEEAEKIGQSGSLMIGMVSGPEGLVFKAGSVAARAAFTPVSRQFIRAERAVQEYADTQKQLNSAKLRAAHFQSVANKVPERAAFLEKQADKFSTAGDIDRAARIRAQAEKMRGLASTSASRVASLADDIAELERVIPGLEKAASAGDTLARVSAAAAQLQRTPFELIGAPLQGTGAALIGIDKGLKALSNKVGIGKAYDYLNKFSTVGLGGGVAAISGFGPMAFVPAAVKTTLSAGPLLNEIGKLTRTLGREGAKVRGSIPYWQRVANASVNPKTKWFAHRMSEVEWGLGKANQLTRGAVPGAVRGAIAGFPVDLGFEYIYSGGELGWEQLKNASAESIVLGGSGGAFGGISVSPRDKLIKVHNNDAINFYRELKTPDQRLAFNSLSSPMKRIVGNTSAAYPGLNIQFTNTGSGRFDTRTNTISINPSSSNPLAPLIGHEFSHYISIRNGMEPAISAILVGDGVQSGGLLRRADGTLDPDFEAWGNEYNRRLSLQHEREMSARVAAGDKISPAQREFKPLNQNQLANEYFSEVNSEDLAEMVEGGRLTQLAQRPASIQKVLSVAESLIDKSSILRDLHFKIGGMMDTKGKMVMGSGLLSEGIRQIPQMRRMYQKMVADTAGRPAYTRRISKQEAEGIEVPDTGFQDPIHDEMFSVYETDENSKPLRDENGIAIPLSSEKDQARSQAGLILIENAAAREQSGQQVEGELKYNPDLDRWNGRFLTNEQIKILSDSGIFNSKQIRNIRTLNEVARDGSGKRFLTIYQPALEKRKGRRAVYKPKKKTMREIVPIGTSITKDGNILITLMSVKQLHANVMEMAGKKMGAKLYNGDPEAIMTDVLEVIRLHGENKSADLYFKNKTEYSADWQNRKNFINAVFGAVGKGQADFNPILNSTKAENGVVKTYRADRMNKTIALDGDTVLPYNNNLVRINYLPEGEPITDASGNIVGMPPIEFDQQDSGQRLMPEGVDEDKFYSQLDRVITEKVPTRATAAQIMATIDPTRGSGVKADEIKWSGIEQALASLEKDGKVSKEDLLNYLRNEGRVRFEEVTISEGRKAYEAERARFGEQMARGEITSEEFRRLVNELDSKESQKPEPKYAQYQLPGGENYREVVLAMPNDAPYQNYRDELVSKYGVEDVERLADPTEVAKLTRLGNESSKASYTSSHFPNIPNYVAHMRTNERVDADGRPGLFVEEFQSDRHQEGRKKGYLGDKESEIDTAKSALLAQEEEQSARMATIEPVLTWTHNGKEIRAHGYLSVKVKESGGWEEYSWDNRRPAEYNAGLTEERGQAFMDFMDAKSLRDDFARKAGNLRDAGVADAPFRTTWPLQLFKRALRDAVDSGKEWVGWTVGETQNDRFNLSKQVGEIRHWKSDEEGYYGVQVIEPNGHFIHEDEMISTDKLADLLGKDVAQRIVDGEGEDIGNNARSLSGDNLKVGGSGMKGFYDNMLPKEIGKYVKPFGGKVEKDGLTKIENGPIEIEGSDETGWAAYDNSGALFAGDSKQEVESWVKQQDKTPIWKVSITPEMRQLAQGGQMRFMPEVDLNKLPENVIVPDDIDVGKEVSKGRNSILKEGDSIGTFRYLPEGFIEKFAITDQDREYLKGKSGFAFVSDWADSERKYVTKNGREIDVMYGGIGYPFIPEMQGKAAWASTRGGKIISAVAKKIESTDGVGLIVLGGKESSASSRAFSIAFTEELLDAVDNGTDVVLLNDAIKKAFIDYNDFLKSKGKKKQLPIAESITDWSNSFGGLTFEDRAALVKRIGSHNNKKSLGILSWNDVLKKYNIQNKDYAPGQIVGIVEFSKKAAMSAEEAEVPYHPSYEAVFPGRNIGTIDQKLMIGDFFKDFFKQEKTKPASYTRKVQTKMPVFTIGEGSAYLPKSTKK
jgi:hypothetical protein